jgi:hypothetical protein
MSPELLLAAQIILGIGALVVPIVVLSVVDRAWCQFNVNRIAKEWCASAGITFKRAELHKNHFTAVAVVKGQTIRRRFRMSRYFLFWKVKRVDWLDPEQINA